MGPDVTRGLKYSIEIIDGLLEKDLLATGERIA